MFDDILEFVAKNKQKLIEKIEKLKKETKEEKVRAHWIPYKPEEKQDVNIAVEDGSYNYIEYKGFVLYALAAEAVGYINENLLIKKCIDVDVLHPYKYTEHRIRFYMSTLEKKVALQILSNNNVDFFLLDGSILGDLIRPAAFEKAPSTNDREFIEKKYLDKIKASLEKKEFSRIISKDFVNEIYSSANLEKPLDSIIYLEYLENLLTVKELLKYEDKVIGISKRSQSTSYFPESRVPDIALFESICRDVGFSKPIPVKLEYIDRYKRRFPIMDKEIREIPLSLFYARFGKNSTVLKFEYVGEPSVDRAKEILDGIAMSTVEGYPYLLRKAHREVVLTQAHIEQIAKILGLYERTGREML